MYCIDADCALTFLMSSEANRLCCQENRQEPNIDNQGNGDFPHWAYADDGTIHLLATGLSQRSRQSGRHCRLVKHDLPRHSFVRLDNTTAIPSPECCFLLLASKLSMPSLIKAGMLLCANFSFDEFGCIAERGEALTSVSRLRSYISKAQSIHGLKNARVALAHIAQGAASPPEIDAYILLTLKPMRGGYACPECEPNGHVVLSAEAARGLGYRDCYCDLLWRSRKCAVEYTSEQFHKGYEERVKDEIRRSALEAAGIRVFFLTKNQLYGMAAFDHFVIPLIRCLGKRVQKPTDAVQEIRYQLRRELLYEPSWILRRACRW